MIIEEVYDVVDKTGKKIGKAPWSEVHIKGLLHQTVHGIVFRDDSRRQTLLKKRSGINPQEVGQIEIAAAGHIVAGSTPKETIINEIREELLGNRQIPHGLTIKKIGKYFNHDIPNNYEIAHIFEIIYPGPFWVSEESEGEPFWVEWDDLVKKLEIGKTREYARYSINAINEYVKLTSSED